MAKLLDRLESRAANGLVNIVIDTPRGSRCKFKYDQELRCYRLSRLLPQGAIFPYNFGSIPRTAGEDGDAIDVLVLADADFFVGCLVTAKLIGVLLARQSEHGKTVRNDRLLASPVTEVNPALFEHLNEIPGTVVQEIEHFFISYNQAHGKKYTPTGHGGPARAEKALQAAEKRYTRQKQ